MSPFSQTTTSSEASLAGYSKRSLISSGALDQVVTDRYLEKKRWQSQDSASPGVVRRIHSASKQRDPCSVSDPWLLVHRFKSVSKGRLQQSPTGGSKFGIPKCRYVCEPSLWHVVGVFLFGAFFLPTGGGSQRIHPAIIIGRAPIRRSRDNDGPFL